MKKSTTKWLGVVVGLLCVPMAFAQKPVSLKQLMWKKANSCYSALEDIDGDGEIDCELIDDSANGYLKMEGWWPTCGCGCATTVGAYKDDKGNYTLLEQEYWSCSWVRKLSSDRQLADVLPEGFGLESFIPEWKIPQDISFARFYIEAEIPRKGTDTKLTIRPVPFGLYMKSGDLLCYEIQERYEEGEEELMVSLSNTKSFYVLQYFVYQLKEDRVLTLILDGKFDQIPSADRAFLQKEIDRSYENFRTMEDIRRSLIELKQTYDLFLQLEHESITLGWDRNKGRFYIKDKGTPPEKKTFLEFLQQAEFYSGIC